MRGINVRLTAYCFVFLFFAALCPPSVAKETGTIILKDGARFADVAYRIDKYFKVVRFTVSGEGKNKAVSFGNIEAILDAAGNNRAPELLQEYYRPNGTAASAAVPIKPADTPPATSPSPVATGDSLLSAERGVPVAVSDTVSPVSSPPAAATANLQPAPKPAQPPEPWRPETDNVYREGRKRLWTGGLCLFGNFSVPVGDWYTDVNAGMGYEADLFLCVSRHIALRAHISRSGLNVDDSFYDILLPGEGWELMSEKSELTVSRYMLMAQYNDPALDKTLTEVRPYIMFGMGVVREAQSLSASARYTATGEWAYTEGDKTDNRFAMTSGVGLVWKIGRNLGFDLEGAADMIFIPTEYQYGESASATAYIIDFKAGLLYLF
ncbi:MAG: hypothetical protein PHR28_06330 [candidate division Zixibacteria bacterium]|nr:hypothetical protein [candidate division Zixibacteria bacterium]